MMELKRGNFLDATDPEETSLDLSSLGGSI